MGSSKKASEYERRITQARTKDIEFFLGEDWVDYGMIRKNAAIEVFKNIGTSSYQPHLCTKCDRYWHYEMTKSALAQEYLSQSIFKGVPVEKGICSECE
tara:strand:- start:382 stop:678 length:297 start_codon:yes stop_codon:yes gene_type:complete